MKLAVISGKGGSGKSSISAAFIALAGAVVALDCDVDASNLPLLFKHTPLRSEPFVSSEHAVINSSKCGACAVCMDQCRFGAMYIGRDGMPRINDILCEGCGACQLVCPMNAISIVKEAGSTITTSEYFLSQHPTSPFSLITASGLLIHGELQPGDDNSGKMIARIREIADEEMLRGGYAHQILDGPPGIGCSVMSTVTNMDKVVIATEPTLSGLSDLQRAYRVASSFCRSISVIINKFNVNPQTTALIEEWCAGQQIPVIARLPFEKAFVEAQIHCQSIVAWAPESESSKQLKCAYRRLFKE